MPPVIYVIADYVFYALVAVGFSSATALAIGLATITVLEYATVYAAISLAEGLVSPRQSGGTQSPGNRPSLEVTLTDSTNAMEVVYGRVRKGGVNILPPWTHGTNNNTLNQIIAHAGHEVDGYAGTFFDSDCVPIESVNTISVSSVSGAVNSGMFAGQARIRNYTGLSANSQFTDYELYTNFTSYVTSWFRGAGIAYTAVAYDWGDAKTWGPRGVPDVTVDLFGKKVYDPRRDTSPGANPTDSAYAIASNNPALCWADFKLNTTYGRQVPAAEIDWNAVVTAANICDAPVAVPGFNAFANSGTGATNSANADGSYRVQRTSGGPAWDASVRGTSGVSASRVCAFSPNNTTGAGMYGINTDPTLDDDYTSLDFAFYLRGSDLGGVNAYIYESGTQMMHLPSNLSADGTASYDTNTVFSIEYENRSGLEQMKFVRYFVNGKLFRTVYSSQITTSLYFDSSMNTSTCDIDLNVERRYTCNGVLSSGADPNDNERALIDAMMGHVCRKGGLWTVYAGAYNATSFDLQKTDWISIDSIQCTAPRDGGRYNGVRVYYVDPIRNWQRVECYPQYDDTYKSQDAGERIWLELQQPMCTYEYEAQRKGRFLLRASRNGMKLAVRLPPKFMNIATYDTVTLTFSELGWSSKVFRAVSTTLNTDGSMNVVLREEQSADWTDMLASEYSTKANTSLPTQIATKPGVPQNFTVKVIDNTIIADWDPGSPLPSGTIFQLYSYPGSLSTISSKTIVWEGPATGKTLVYGVSSPQWFQVRARVHSNYSAFSPSTYGVGVATTYSAPTSTGAWSVAITPTTLNKGGTTSGLTTAAATAVVNNGTTPVYSWTNPGSANITITKPGSADTTFSASGLALDESRAGTFYCNVKDGANVSSKSLAVSIQRYDFGSEGGPPYP